MRGGSSPARPPGSSSHSAAKLPDAERAERVPNPPVLTVSDGALASTCCGPPPVNFHSFEVLAPRSQRASPASARFPLALVEMTYVYVIGQRYVWPAQRTCSVKCMSVCQPRAGGAQLAAPPPP